MIKQCEACHIDFETDHDAKRFCSTRACKSDRQAEQNARYYERLRIKEPEAAKHVIYGREFRPKGHTRVVRDGHQRKTHRSPEE